MDKFKLHDQSHVVSTAEWNNIESRQPVEERRILMNIVSWCATNNVVSHRAVEERRILARRRRMSYLAVYWPRTDRKNAEIRRCLTGRRVQRCFPQSSIYRLPGRLKDEQYVYFKYGSEKK